MGRWDIIGFSWLDWALVLVLLVIIVNGFRRGFWVSMGTIIGAIAVVLGGLVLMPAIVELVPAGVVRLVAMVAVTAVLIWVRLWLGQIVGRRLRLQISLATMRTIDNFLGAIGNAAIAAVLNSLVAFSVSSDGVPGLPSVLKQSRILYVVTHPTRES